MQVACGIGKVELGRGTALQGRRGGFGLVGGRVESSGGLAVRGVFLKWVESGL